MTLGLMTWNVQWFRGLDGQVDIARVLAHARDLCDFDVLCLQEVSVGMTGLAGHEASDQAAEVARLLPEHEVIFTPAVDYRRSDGRKECFGNLIATRLSVLSVEQHLLPWVREAGNASARRACTAVLLQASSGPLTVMNTHLEFHSASQRALQVARILDIQRERTDLATSSGKGGNRDGIYRDTPLTSRAILCGDFNFDVGSSEYLSLTRGQSEFSFRDVFDVLRPGQRREPTFGCFDRTYQEHPVACDHIFCTADLAQLCRAISVDGDTRLSDHQPVFAQWEAV